jgi:putative ABC transport system substrate-binding protein
MATFGSDEQPLWVAVPTIETAFDAISKEQVSGVEVLPDPTSAAQSARITALAAKARLPSIGGNSVYAKAGGPMTYGPNFSELARRAGAYAAKILKGAKPGELAVDRPTKFEFVINMKAANQIGVTISQSLLQRADQVIQ